MSHKIELSFVKQEFVIVKTACLVEKSLDVQKQVCTKILCFSLRPFIYLLQKCIFALNFLYFRTEILQ